MQFELFFSWLCWLILHIQSIESKCPLSKHWRQFQKLDFVKMKLAYSSNKKRQMSLATFTLFKGSFAMTMIIVFQHTSHFFDLSIAVKLLTVLLYYYVTHYGPQIYVTTKLYQSFATHVLQGPGYSRGGVFLALALMLIHMWTNKHMYLLDLLNISSGT